MASTVVQFRVDKELKEQAQEIYEKLGLDLPSALRIFLKRSVEQEGIPFAMTLRNQAPQSTSLEEGRNAFYAARKALEANNISEMSLEEINAEIRAARSGT